MSREGLSGKIKLALPALFLLFFLAGCSGSWEATVTAPDGSDFVVEPTVLEDLSGFDDEDLGIPLERVLWTAGHRVIDRLLITGPDGSERSFEWATVAKDAWWQEDGQISVGAEEFPVARLAVEPPQLLSQVQTGITSIAPTVATALGLPAPELAASPGLPVDTSRHVLLLFLDGFGYVRYQESLHKDLIPNISALGEPLAGLTVYPPSTSVATAALLTGAGPRASGVDQRGIRKTEAQTIFDVAAAKGLEVRAVEGDALAFNLRSTDMQLSGDRDGNGSTDDNVLANTLLELEDGMPHLLFVHFHGIDDAGHTYGPNTPEEEAAIREVDTAVGELMAALPKGTLTLVFADHGMHQVQGAKPGERQGNHGHLIERDMIIPIFVVSQ